MPTINVTEVDAVAQSCPTCGSYIHRFLDRCPRCGWARVAAYIPLIPDPPPHIEGPLPRTHAELARWLAAHEVPRDVASKRMDDIASIDEREPLAGELISSVAINSFRRADGSYNGAPYLAALARFFAHKDGRIRVRVMAEKIGYRYQGGVPEYPGPTDAKLTYGDGYLLLLTSRGEVITKIPPERILFATSFVQQTGGSSWLGLRFGHVIYFPDHTFTGGALRVTWAVGAGATRTFILGNRDGWSTRKGPSGFYYGLVQIIGIWANMGACARQAEIGLPPYARELGFNAVDPAPESQAPAARGPEGIPEALNGLDELRAKRLVTDEEYAAKRAEILARL